MSKKRKRQKSQKTRWSQHSAAQKGNKRRLPSLKETEAYIKEHNLEVMNPLSDFGLKRLLASERNTLSPVQMRFYEECQINNFTDMEKQDYVKSLMEYPSVQEMVDCERADAKTAAADTSPRPTAIPWRHP